MIQCVVTVKSRTTTHVRRIRRNAGILKPSGFAVFAVELACTLVCMTYIVHKNTFHLHLPYSKCLYYVVFVNKS